MSNSSSSSSSSGIGFVGLLTIVFITLKLLGKIDWSWIWILSPIWISTSLVLGLFILGFVIWLIVQGIKEIAYRQRQRRRREQFRKRNAA